MNLNAAFESVVWLCGGLAAIGGALVLLWKAVKPMATMKKDIEDMKEGFRVMCKCLLTLLRHAETGNCTGEIKKSLEEMEDYLTKL